MLKPILILILSLFIFTIASAQKADTVVGYLKKTGKIVSTRDSADYMLVILPPDTNVDKNLFRVDEIYLNNKIRLLGNATNNTLPLKFQGNQITFFPNGHKMSIGNYNNGQPTGDMTAYYPNGKFYNIKSYSVDKKVYLKQCKDSVGNLLTENGNGKWVNFLDENFSAYITGEVKNGLEEGEWRGKLNDTTNLFSVYRNGELFAAADLNKTDKDSTFSKVDEVPKFSGGLDAFGRFLGTHIRYPAAAKENNIQGRVIIGFIVEKDGTLSHIKVVKGIGGGCDEEVARITSLSPPWIPGKQNGVPVRVIYSVPVDFTLSSDDRSELRDIDYLPQFPGGATALYKFLVGNVKYPDIARKNKTQGKVVISFIVEADGTLSNIKVKRGIGDGCDQEALRIMKLSPKWKPRIVNGQGVRVPISIPFSFKLSDK